MRAPTVYGGATDGCKCISPLRFPPRCRGAHRAPADIIQIFDFSPQRPPSLREGDRPQAVEGVSASRARRHYSNLRFFIPKTSLLEGGGPSADCGRSKRIARPPTFCKRSILPPQTSLLEGGGPPAGGGRSSHAAERVRSHKSFPLAHNYAYSPRRAKPKPVFFSVFLRGASM